MVHTAPHVSFTTMRYIFAVHTDSLWTKEKNLFFSYALIYPLYKGTDRYNTGNCPGEISFEIQMKLICHRRYSFCISFIIQTPFFNLKGNMRAKRKRQCQVSNRMCFVFVWSYGIFKLFISWTLAAILSIFSVIFFFILLPSK